MDLALYVHQSDTLCMKIGICPKHTTEIKVRETYEEYTLHKTTLLLTEAGKCKDEKSDKKTFKNQNHAECQKTV